MLAACVVAITANLILIALWALGWIGPLARPLYNPMTL